VALLALLGAATAAAALSVDPSRVVLRVKPGEVRTGVFTVTNPGETPVTVDVEPEDWSQGAGGARQSVSWLTVKPTRFTLRPGRSARVTYAVRTPREASGELRAQVFFTTQQAPTSTGMFAMRSRLGAILYVAIHDTERVAAQVRDLRWTYTASTPEVAAPDRLTATLVLRNEGNVHLVPEGWVTVEDADGRALARGPLRSGWGVLPGEEETYDAVLHGVHLAPGRYRLVARLQVGQDVHHPTALTHSEELLIEP
jgi:P pilus assembly chaperone PapD